MTILGSDSVLVENTSIKVSKGLRDVSDGISSVIGLTQSSTEERRVWEVVEG